MPPFDIDLLNAEDLLRRLRDLEDSMTEIRLGRGVPRLLGMPMGFGDPQDADLVRFDAGLNGWVPWSPKYLSATLSASQTGNLGAGNHVEFDTVDVTSGHVALSTGAGQADGIFTLPEGTWRLTAIPTINFSGGGAAPILDLRWAVNGGVVFGSRPLRVMPLTSTNSSFPSPICEAFLVVGAGGEDVELRIVGAPNSVTSIGAFTNVLIEAIA